MPFTKENLNDYLKELGKEFRKLNGKKMPAEIVLIGGAAILANYGFREATYDIDAIILASSVMKEAINRVGDKFGLPSGWLNTDFKRTTSFSDKLLEISVYYKTFSNVITVRTVAAEYLIAMKLMSGRQYKNDLSDIAGILWEHQRNGNPISREAINGAITILYSDTAELSPISLKILNDAFADGDYERAYKEIRESEKQAKDILVDFDKTNPGELKGENINTQLDNKRYCRLIQWYGFVGILLYFLIIIANPISLILLSKHFWVKHNINFAVSVVMPIVSGIGSVLILNSNRWFGKWDPINDIIFIVELIIVGIILLIGLLILTYLRLKNTT